MQYLHAAPTLLAIMLLALLGFLVVHNQHKRVNLSFLLFVAADSFWLASVYAVNFTQLNTNVILGRIVFAASICLVLGTFSFIDALLHFYRLRGVKLTLYICSSVLLVLTLLTPLIIKGVGLGSHDSLGAAFPIYGPLYILFPIYIFFGLSAIFTPLLRRDVTRRSKSEVTAQQLAFVRWGLALFALLSITTNLLLPAFFGRSWTPFFTPVGSLILASSFFIAIGRYKLFDIRFVALRAAAYLTTLVVITFAFIAPFVWVIDRILGEALNGGQFALVVVLSVGLLYALQYVRKFFDHVTARVFFRNEYDPQDVQDKLNDILVRTVDLAALCADTAKILEDALRATSIEYVLASDDDRDKAALAKEILGWCIERSQGLVIVDEVNTRDGHFIDILKRMNVATVLRLHTTHEDMGFMLVGHKRSGELYSARDIRLLGIAADEIAISLQNVLRYKQIQQFNLTLQEEVDEATRKLKRQNKRLEELDDIKDDFISMASHQLRTPLTSVKGYLSMVLEGDAGKLNGTQTQMLKQAFASSQRMVFLITDLLNVSRLKTGKFIIDAAPLNLADVIADEVEQLQETAHIKGLELIFQKPNHFPELMLDDIKTRQVIMNFIDNAIYYTPTGGRIKVELTETSSAVELRVADNGIGVPKAEQHHLFTKFYRATNARKTRPDGTGLGLFMAHKVVVAQGGAIIFSSTEGKGSTFGFSFPKHKLRVPEAPKKPTKVPVAAGVDK